MSIVGEGDSRVVMDWGPSILRDPGRLETTSLNPETTSFSLRWVGVYAVCCVLCAVSSIGVWTDGRRHCAGSKLAGKVGCGESEPGGGFGGEDPDETYAAPHWWSEWRHARAPVQPPTAEVPLQCRWTRWRTKHAGDWLGITSNRQLMSV